jgi:uncharacterized protein (TIGR00725 family)
MKKIQIGVLGSVADLKYTAEAEKTAFEIGTEIARAGAVLLYGIEPAMDTLPTAAMRGAKAAGGLTIGLALDRDRRSFNGDPPDMVISTGLGPDGGREYALAVSCDAVIAIGGGAGTLKEMACAYSAGIPVIAMRGTGGWSDKLIGTYMDERRRLPIVGADSPAEATAEALKLAKNGAPM